MKDSSLQGFRVPPQILGSHLYERRHFLFSKQHLSVVASAQKPWPWDRLDISRIIKANKPIEESHQIQDSEVPQSLHQSLGGRYWEVRTKGHIFSRSLKQEQHEESTCLFTSESNGDCSFYLYPGHLSHGCLPTNQSSTCPPIIKSEQRQLLFALTLIQPCLWASVWMWACLLLPKPAKPRFRPVEQALWRRPCARSWRCEHFHSRPLMVPTEGADLYASDPPNPNTAEGWSHGGNTTCMRRFAVWWHHCQIVRIVLLPWLVIDDVLEDQWFNNLLRLKESQVFGCRSLQSPRPFCSTQLTSVPIFWNQYHFSLHLLLPWQQFLICGCFV